jgi:hypothetical protein
LTDLLSLFAEQVLHKLVAVSPLASCWLLNYIGAYER